jgi:hypothetical protein
VDEAETTVKDFYAAGFDAQVKRWYKWISVGGGHVEKLMLFANHSHWITYVSITTVIYTHDRLHKAGVSHPLT